MGTRLKAQRGRERVCALGSFKIQRLVGKDAVEIEKASCFSGSSRLWAKSSLLQVNPSHVRMPLLFLVLES